MSSAPAAAPGLDDPEPNAVAWDLEPLVAGEGEAGVDRLLDEGAERARAFAERHAGKLGEFESSGLAAAMEELGEIFDRVGRASAYAMLGHATDTADPARGALLQKVRERGTGIETTLLFFELEWCALEDERAEALLAAENLEFYRHHLRSLRRYRPHQLSEPEERIASEKAVTAAGAWRRLFAELTSAIEVELPAAAASVKLDVALSKLHSPDRATRREVATAITAALEPGMRTRAFVFNTLLHDKAVEDRLRAYPHWLAERNLANEASDESVRALIEAVQGRYELARRWYRLKAKLLGIERIADYDRIASVGLHDPEIGWDEARAVVLDAYDSLSPEVGGLVRRFFDERWIDAPVRPSKRGGAFCSYAVPSVHPYVMLNYTARQRDVLTLAHELGHGLHAALARAQGIFHFTTPLTVAETASVFGEELTFGRLLARESEPAARLTLLADSVEGAIATVFRQTAMNGFEALVHTARREQGELSVDRLGSLWIESQRDFVGDSVELTDGYRSWWSYIPHFVNTPGYVYAYAYGQLLALSVYRRYEQAGEAFVPDYLSLLQAGGSRSPEELGAIVGVDLSDPGFWNEGLDLIERRLDETEAAAHAAGRL